MNDICDTCDGTGRVDFSKQMIWGSCIETFCPECSEEGELQTVAKKAFRDGRKLMVKLYKNRGYYVWRMHLKNKRIFESGIKYRDKEECIDETTAFFGVEKWDKIT